MQLRLKITEYYEYLQRSGQSVHDKRLFEQLPKSLELQLELSLKSKLITTCGLFEEISALAVLDLVRVLSHTIAIPDELIIREGEVDSKM